MTNSSRLELSYDVQYIESEAYHLEAINSDPMLGFFSEPIKIYFLIWSVAHWYVTISSSLLGSNGGHGCCFCVDSSLSFLDLFLRSSRKSNEFCFGAANAISRLEITEVSIVGKHSFLYQSKSGNHAMFENVVHRWKKIFMSTSLRRKSSVWVEIKLNFRLEMIIMHLWSKHHLG